MYKTQRFYIIVLMITMLIVSAASSYSKSKNQIYQYETQIGLLERNTDIYYDKVYGAWYGKLIGLIAGQPVEGWPKPHIEKKAKEAGIYPLRDFIASNFDSPAKNFLKGNFNASPPNDDSDFMLTAMLAIRDNGIHLTSRDMAEAWLKYTYGGCTAEGVAHHNFSKNIWPPESATTDNPYADWIGAQMRIDIWGIISPGMPEKAADYAEMDARISHTGDGIYAARYIAALISLAMVDNDLEKIVSDALAFIPKDCRYADAVRDTIKWHSENKDWEDAWANIDNKYGMFSDGSRFRDFKEEKYKTGHYKNWNDMKWVYADVNGAAVVLALLYGECDFTKSLSIAVSAGFDNDCNAGTVGGVLGAMRGEKAIPTRWKAPLNDTYITGVKLPNNRLKISDLASETSGYGLQVMSER